MRGWIKEGEVLFRKENNFVGVFWWDNCCDFGNVFDLLIFYGNFKIKRDI